MEREPSHRDETAPRVKKPAKAAPQALPHAVVSDALEPKVSCDVVPGADGRDPALAHVEPTQRSAGSLAKSTATYRVVINCVVDRRDSDASR